MTTAAPASDATAARAFAAVLEPGEHLLWAGRPDARRTTRVDGRLVGLGVFWTLVAGAGFYGFGTTALGDDFRGMPYALRALLLVVAAAPFVAVAAYCLGGHVVLRRRRRARTAYAVTTTRVLASEPAFGSAGPARLRALARATLGAVQVEPERHGCGTLEFHDARGVEPSVMFRSIADAEAVAALARGTPDGT